MNKAERAIVNGIRAAKAIRISIVTGDGTRAELLVNKEDYVGTIAQALASAYQEILNSTKELPWHEVSQRV